MRHSLVQLPGAVAETSCQDEAEKFAQAVLAAGTTPSREDMQALFQLLPVEDLHTEQEGSQGTSWSAGMYRKGGDCRPSSFLPHAPLFRQGLHLVCVKSLAAAHVYILRLPGRRAHEAAQGPEQ